MIRSSPALPLFVAWLATAALPVAGQAQSNAPLEVFYGFTLIDGTGRPPIEDAAIATRGNRILSVGTRLELLASPAAPRDAIVTNLGGGYVVPGLIDTHVHLATVPNRRGAEAELHRMLYAGVTAVRDMAGDARALASLARDSRLGQIPAPDVYFSALMAGPSFFADPRPQSSAAGEHAGHVPWMQSITPESDLVTAVARAKGTSATGIKIYANLEPAEVRNITSEARRQGMKVWAHSMVFPTRPLQVVQSGVDVISHVCRLAWEGMSEAPVEYHHDQTPRYGNLDARSTVFTALFGAMRANGTILDATLAMYARAAADPDSPPAARCDLDFARSLVRRAADEGLPISAGTDFTAEADDPYPALHQELEELVEGAGLSPMQAIEAATRVAAEAVGIEETHGLLVSGRPVSFVHLAEDPLADIGNLRTVRAVWKNGDRFDRSAYRSLVVEQAQPAEHAAPQGPASAEAALEGWLAAWRRYDLEALDAVLLQDPSLTYFPNDAQGAVEGFRAVRAYHQGLGFVPGGFRPEADVWLEKVLIADFDESAVVTARWHFGNRVLGEVAARGPLTLVVVRTAAGYRISHVNMANYPPKS
jgi:imidazolonepropionase-like amidohydrolase/ketosteroid isomerase-like protein